MKKYLVIIIFILIVNSTKAQFNSFFQQRDLLNTVERFEMKTGCLSPELHTDIRPLNNVHTKDFLWGKNFKELELSDIEKFNLESFKENNSTIFDDKELILSKKPILKVFYKNRGDFFRFNKNNLTLVINPLIYFQGGKEIGNDKILYRNTRGVNVKGFIAKKVGFYTYITDNQVQFPTYIDSFISKKKAIPGEGYHKVFKDSVGQDYLSAGGFIDFNAIKQINVQIGHGKNFIGNGYRSLFLSDFAKNYMYLKINTKIWRLNYQNLFTELTNINNRENNIYQKKYGAFHYLTIDLCKKLRVGLFEGIIFGDSNKFGRGFDLNYLNPVIFYRWAEHNNGSGDNGLLGLSFLYYPLKNVSVYGQLLLDEFKFSELKKDFSWWANKYGLQFGIKYIDAFKVSNLDLQLELNTVRPYTYSHTSHMTSYVHYNQNLAHPMGANFREMIGIVKFQPFKRLTTELKISYTQQGLDTNIKFSYGADPSVNYHDRAIRNYGAELLQGIKTTISQMNVLISYQIKQNIFIDLNAIYRKQESDLKRFENDAKIINMSFRMNIPYKSYNF